MAYTLPEYMKTLQDPFMRGIIGFFLNEPVFGVIPFRTIPGLSYGYSKREVLPVIHFRKLNEAFTATQGIVNRETENLRLPGGDSDTDKALVRAYGPEERTSRDADFVDALTYTYVQYMLYGNCGARVVGSPYDDVDAFDGFVTRLTAGQTVNAAGTSATAGSSVFAVRFEDRFCTGLQNHDIDVRDLGEIDTKPVMRTRIDWATGIAIFHGKAVARIKNIDTTAVLTVAMMDELRDKVVQRRPTCYIMSARSQRQLKTSAYGMSVILPTGLDAVGRPVNLWDGVPILVSDAVVDTENNTV